MTEPAKQLVIDVEDLDRIFEDMINQSGPDVSPKAYTNAYHSGKEDGIREFHLNVMNEAEVIIE